MSIQLGPNHKDYGKPIDVGPAPRGVAARIEPARDENGDIRRFTLAEIVKAFAAQHARRYGDPCPCLLCADLRWHIEQRKAERAVAR